MTREIRIFNVCWDKSVLVHTSTSCNVAVTSVLERNEKGRHVIGVSLPKKSVILEGGREGESPNYS
jgi:hypothetical protein